MRFRDIPQFISDGSYQVNMSWEYLIEWLDQRIKEDGLQLNPDFQRGHVWTEEQQIKFLEFILQGGKTGRTLYFNDPYWHSVRPKTGYADFVCVDGLQRITAIQRFMNNEIRVFGIECKRSQDKERGFTVVCSDECWWHTAFGRRN